MAPSRAGRTGFVPVYSGDRENSIRAKPPISLLVKGFAFYCVTKAERIIYMKELLLSIASGLVEDASAVSVDVDEPDAEGVIVYHLHVAPDDMGRVIGKQGRIAKAIRTVMRAGAGRANQKIMVEID